MTLRDAVFNTAVLGEGLLLVHDNSIFPSLLEDL